MPASIWKDYEVGFGAVAESDFTIELDGSTIYSGHAVRRPDQTSLNVRINDICADYLDHAVPVVSSLVSTAEDSAATFVVKDGGGTTVDTVQFVSDWSFDHDHSVSTLADPVNGRVSAAQSLVLSVLGSSSTTATLVYKNGSTGSVSVAASAGPVQVLSIPLSSYTNLARITVSGKTYTVVDACHEFALLYVNSFGGWDTLLMEGRSQEVDSYERSTMTQRYDNAVISNRGRVEYVNEVTRHWTLRTGWLSDLESFRMHHVLGSPHVFLYDLVDGVIRPVVITDESCQYKTFKGNGSRLVSYTVDVDLAQTMIRR